MKRPCIKEEQKLIKQCIKEGTHLKNVDRDGYCNTCGHQETEGC